jgi:competence ComEA-like helix-hairpin-helix protein
MALLSKLESRLGLTRGDVTVALFVALATLGGFIYITFFDSRSPAIEHQELLALTMRHDSIVAERKRTRVEAVSRIEAASDSSTDRDTLSATPADSIATWKPLTAADAAIDDAIVAGRKPPSRGGSKDAPSRPVNLNAASKADLTRLPGVGEKTADAIIERRGHLPFRRIEDIMEVKGIGEKKFETMKPYLTVR